MKIYIIRHGETKEGAEGIILGSMGGNLNENGINYAHEVANYFKVNNVIMSKIIASDLNRAIRTADIIAQELKVGVEFETLIRERSAGKSEGKNENEIDWQSYELLPLEARKHASGESFQEVKNRAQLFLDKIKLTERHNVLIVSHSVFNLMFISLINGLSIENALKLKTGNKIIVIDLETKNIEMLEITHSQ